MSDIINLLPDSVANQIAAGEVVQRPSSVIKELIENAVDAGAGCIEVAVEEAGKTSIQVVDDGKGMSSTDARMSFERHATSKIRQAADLFALTTMGFRGEALASIAAVAQVELRTRTSADEIGTQVVIEGSNVISQGPVSCRQGCNFIVKNLFYNVPARRKFLKSNQTELSNIMQEFERVALVHPDIAFSLSHNNSLVLQLPKCNLRQRIINVFGKKQGEQLLPIEVETSLVKITGFVGKPETARKKGSRQYFFVNGRYMRHPYFNKAVAEAFEQFVSAGEQVSYFLYFEVDPANIDVNIHPTKTEIKFENELAIWQIIVAAIKESLGKFNAVPTIDFDMEGAPEIPTFGNGQDEGPLLSVPQVDINPDFNPFESSSRKSSKAKASPSNEMESGDMEFIPSARPFDDMEFGAEIPDLPDESQAQEFTFDGGEMQAMEFGGDYFQYKGRYIITSVKSGLMIIHQSRAHMRVLYDKYRMQMEGGYGQSQRLLFPEMIQLPPSDAVLLEHLLDDMQIIGFDIAPIGGCSFTINAIPSAIDAQNPVEIVQQIIHSALDKGCQADEGVRHAIAISLARSGAIPMGRNLGEQEMKVLVEDLFLCQNPNLTPDGKVIVTILVQNDLDKLFG